MTIHATVVSGYLKRSTFPVTAVNLRMKLKTAIQHVNIAYITRTTND